MKRAGRGRPTFPQLTQTAEVHGWWFPRLVDGKLRLADLDELILSLLADDWRTPIDLLRSDRGTELSERLFMPFGDLYFLRRLQDWVQHGGVETKADGGANPWTSVAYRLTDTGRALSSPMACAASTMLLRSSSAVAASTIRRRRGYA